jgi:hypothetical protein
MVWYQNTVPKTLARTPITNEKLAVATSRPYPGRLHQLLQSWFAAFVSMEYVTNPASAMAVRITATTIIPRFIHTDNQALPVNSIRVCAFSSFSWRQLSPKVNVLVEQVPLGREIA